MSLSPARTERLIVENQGLVRSLAFAIHRGLPEYIELDDVIAYGQIGLAQAARDFDPDRGIAFSTFAYQRVRGSIYDGLSDLGWFSRAYRRKIKAREMAEEALREQSSTESAADDGADDSSDDALGDAGSDIRWFRETVSSLAITYFAGPADDDPELVIRDPRSSPAAQAGMRELQGVIEQGLHRLDAQSAQLVRLLYYEDLTLSEAGDRLGISKSWASRLHAEALKSLSRFVQRQGWE